MDYITEVYKNIYLAKIPLKKSPLKNINVYIIKGKNENLIVDTGFNTKEIVEYTKGFIEYLNLDLSKTKLFLTHLHSDHTGLINFYDELKVKIYMGEVDSKMHIDFMKRYGKYWPMIEKFGHMQGMDKDNIKIEDHPGYKFRPTKDYSYEAVNPGDLLNIGDFKFKFIDLSGHTPGMLGLYEEKEKLLFSGDHILEEITPNIQFWNFEIGDSLGRYLENLEKVKKLQVKYIFSSHRDLPKNPNKRIDEIKSHHKKRLDEIFEIFKKASEELKKGDTDLKYLKNVNKVAANVRYITKNLNWDIKAKDFEDFPKAQKWFAAGEAHAHLEHLRNKGLIDFVTPNDNVFYYFVK